MHVNRGGLNIWINGIYGQDRMGMYTHFVQPVLGPAGMGLSWRRRLLCDLGDVAPMYDDADYYVILANHGAFWENRFEGGSNRQVA